MTVIDETLSAVDRLRQLSNLVTPMALRVAATLRLADLIAEGETTVDDLAARSDTNRDALGRLLRYLTSIGIVTKTGDSFSLTELGDALRSTNPDSPVESLDVNGIVGRITLANAHLLEAIKTGDAAYPLQFGHAFWEDLAKDPELGAVFNRHMSAGDTTDAVGAYDWGSARHVVDVGGGDGRLLTDILRAHPDVRGTLVELPGPADAARERFSEEGVSSRTSVMRGSFFDPLPSGADVYILSNIIHDWNDEKAAMILRRCAEAAGNVGAVVVFQGILDSPDDLGMAEWDLFMLVCCGGKQRTLEEFQALGETVGLKMVRTAPVDSNFGHLLEYRPA
jgi:2,7-dihydroxy-5-methyl-1-naphthoate 7-O-methyltransferase